MPRPAVVAEGQRLIGLERLKVSALKGRAGASLAAAAALARGCFSGDAQGQQNDMIELVIQPLAEAFEVSRPAMRIRLEQLGFIVHDGDTTLSMFADGGGLHTGGRKWCRIGRAAERFRPHPHWEPPPCPHPCQSAPTATRPSCVALPAASATAASARGCSRSLTRSTACRARGRPDSPG